VWACLGICAVTVSIPGKLPFYVKKGILNENANLFKASGPSVHKHSTWYPAYAGYRIDHNLAIWSVFHSINFGVDGYPSLT
jgi:hypothetical protein